MADDHAGDAAAGDVEELAEPAVDGAETASAPSVDLVQVTGPGQLDPQAAAMQAGMTLFGSADPKLIVAKIGEVSTELDAVIKAQGLFTEIPGAKKDHVDVEGWQVCGTFFGVQPHVVKIERCEPARGFGVKRKTKRWGKIDGKRCVIEETEDVWMAQGFSYRVWVEARNMIGQVVGRGIGFCSREESKWISADEYAVIGMASTRAVSRTLRQSFAFVIAMAGYGTTPTEEMEGGGPNGPPFGPELPDDQEGRVREALAYLLDVGDGPDADGAAELYDQLVKDCAGYMPLRVGRAAMFSAAALRSKLDANSSSDDDDKPPADGGGDDKPGDDLPPAQEED